MEKSIVPLKASLSPYTPLLKAAMLVFVQIAAKDSNLKRAVELFV